jgi:hypothetical protein
MTDRDVQTGASGMEEIQIAYFSLSPRERAGVRVLYRT